MAGAIEIAVDNELMCGGNYLLRRIVASCWGRGNTATVFHGCGSTILRFCQTGNFVVDCLFLMSREVLSCNYVVCTDYFSLTV